MSYITSDFAVRVKKLSDNSLFWGLVDHLKGLSYKITHDFGKVLDGHDIELICFPYPKPHDLEHLKMVVQQIKQKAKK